MIVLGTLSSLLQIRRHSRKLLRVCPLTVHDFYQEPQTISMEFSKRPPANGEGKTSVHFESNVIRDAYFSMQVFADQSAYICAAGSSFARNPTRTSFLLRPDSPSLTSASRPFAIVAARMTLQVGGTAMPVPSMLQAQMISKTNEQILESL
jgi:hypothetical protein